jgi:hypothetical protein
MRIKSRPFMILCAVAVIGCLLLAVGFCPERFLGPSRDPSDSIEAARTSCANADRLQEPRIAATTRLACAYARRNEEAHLEYQALNSRYDLRRINTYSPADRHAVLVAAGVPDDAEVGCSCSHFGNDLAVLRAFRDNRQLYK